MRKRLFLYFTFENDDFNRPTKIRFCYYNQNCGYLFELLKKAVDARKKRKNNY